MAKKQLAQTSDSASTNQTGINRTLTIRGAIRADPAKGIRRGDAPVFYGDHGNWWDQTTRHIQTGHPLASVARGSEPSGLKA